MKLPSRTILVLIAGMLATYNAIVIWGLQNRPVAIVTYVGLHSLSVVGPTTTKSATLEHGRWKPELESIEIPMENMARKIMSLTPVSLSPNQTYGHFIEVIRDLRARKKCNVLIREDGKPLKALAPHPDGSFDSWENSAIVLCGHQIGDAGFSGTLPPDEQTTL